MQKHAQRFGSPEFLSNPVPELERLRAQGPLTRIKVPIIGTCWATTTDAAARAVLKDDSRFARNPVNAGGRDMARIYWWMPRSLRPLLHTLLAQDGDAHQRLRKAVDSAFARVQVADMRGELEAIADRLLADLPTNAPVDLVSAYARPLPLQAICILLGIAPELRDTLSRAIAPISGPTGFWTLLRGLPGLKKANALLRREIHRHRSTNADAPGLLPRMVQQNLIAPETDNPLTEDEILAMALMLFIAGHETTLHLISNALLSLARQPDLRSQLFEAPGRFIEEMLRVHSPVMMSKPLFVRKDTEFEGQALKQGEKIMALLVAGNFDPNRFSGPETLDPLRRPNAHLSFGFGPHICLGMQLARLETEVALAQIIKRCPNLRLAEPSARPAYSKRFGLRGLTELSVRLGDPA